MKAAEAQAALAAILAQAQARGVFVTVAVVDDHGDLYAAARMDHCRPRWMRVSIRKAYTSAVMDRTTQDFNDMIVRRQLQISYYGQPRFTALPGGIPIVAADGSTYGAIGVTGLPTPQDEELARVGLASFPVTAGAPAS
jgi:glc operon protein GlcG